MKEKLITAKDEFKRQMKKLSILSTLTINLIYIGYLTYSLMNDVGIRIVNISLIIGTAVFLLAYLFLQLVGQKQKDRLKSTKRTYKRFKLITKVFTTATAVYSLITAANSTNIVATVITAVGAGFLVLRIIIEIVAELIRRKAKKMKEEFIANREAKKAEKLLPKRREIKKAKKVQPEKAHESVDEPIAEDTCARSVEDFD